MAYYKSREDVTEAQIEKGRDTAKNRKGFVLYHDYLGTLKKILTPEQIGLIILALGEYATSFKEQDLHDPALNMAYEMGINGINRDIDKYAMTCARRSAAAVEREAKKREQPITTTQPDVKTIFTEIEKLLDAKEMTLTETVNELKKKKQFKNLAITDILKAIGDNYDSPVPSDALCRIIENHMDLFGDINTVFVLDIANEIDDDNDYNGMERRLNEAYQRFKAQL